MELRIAIRVADDRDHKHLSSTIRLANQRRSPIRLQEAPLPEADVVILRRGEQVSAPLLRACEAGGHPVPVIYTMSDRENGTWSLRWPARTTELIALAEMLYPRLPARQADEPDNTAAPARNTF